MDGIAYPACVTPKGVTVVRSVLFSVNLDILFSAATASSWCRDRE